MNIKKRIWGRSYESIFSLKTEILLEFLRLGSKLFHSIIADGKKNFFEKVILCLYKGNIALSGKATKLSVPTTKLEGLKPQSKYLL